MSEKYIHSDADIHESCHIDTFVVIGKGVKLEKDVYVASGAKLYGKVLIQSGTYIGENCIIGHPQRKDLKEILKDKNSRSQIEGPLVSIGKNCTIRAGTIIYSEVTMGNDCQTGHNAMIREKTTIGVDTLIGTNSIIDGNTSIGNDVSIQTGVYIPLFSTIGDHVFLGPYSVLTNDKYMMRKKFELIGPVIEGYVSVGANAVVFPGIILRERTVVGAGAIVNKDTNPNDIIVGNPAKVIKKIPEDWK
jgi:acetyltransferase-like isoleucine patch superfamily enzyme